MTIEFKNIVNVSPELVKLIRTWRNNPKISQYMYTNHFISEEEHQQWVENLRTKNTAKAWIILYNKKPIGIVSLSNVDFLKKTTEWGFYIADESARGKGIGSAVLYHLMEYVFDEMKFLRMTTMVLENNPGALHLYKKFGFSKVGTQKEQMIRDGRRVSVNLMGISKDKWNTIKKIIPAKESIKKFK